MKRYPYTFGTAIIALAATMPAFAQSSRDAGVNDDDAIIVTARRSEEKLQDVPISITVLNQQAISNRNIYNARDLGSYVPSLSTNDTFGPQKSSFAIRGFIQEGRTSPSVGVYFADVVAPRANTGTTSGNGAGIGSLFDLQNVQVLKGPQGTLFGRNTTGGAILLVPTKPVDNLEGSIEATVGNFDARRLQGILNVPLSDTFRVRLAVDRNKADGYLRNRSGTGRDRLGDTDYIAARLSLVGDLTPSLENYTIFSYSRTDTNGVVPRVVSCDTNPAPGTLPSALAPLACAQAARGRTYGFWDVEDSNPNARELQETWQVINTTTWQASDTLTVKNIVSYAEFREKASFNLFGDNFTVPGVPGLRLPGITIGSGYNGDYAAQSTFTEELQLQGRTADNRLAWQAGAYLEISKPLDFNSAYNAIFIDCPNIQAFQCNNILEFGSISSSNIKDTFNNKGLYAQATYKLTEQLSLTGGIRYTMDRMRDESRNININFPTPGTVAFTCQNILKFNRGSLDLPVTASGPAGAECNSVLKVKSNRPTWLIDLDYKPNDDVLLYAKWARGYRQGGIISGNLGIETWGPEKVDTYEVGAKTSFRGAVSGYFNIAGFYNDFRDQQLSVGSVIAPQFAGKLPPVQAIVNAGKSRIWGVEVDGAVRPFEGFKVDFGYTYLNTKLISIATIVPPIFYARLDPAAQEGEPLAQSPKHRYVISATYTLPLDESIGAISLGGTLTHTDAYPAVSRVLAPTTYKIQKTDLINVNVDWASVLGSPFDIAFFMTNATNQKRLVSPGSSFLTNGAEAGHLNLPRMYGLRLKYSFGR